MKRMLPLCVALLLAGACSSEQSPQQTAAPQGQRQMTVNFGHGPVPLTPFQQAQHEWVTASLANAKAIAQTYLPEATDTLSPEDLDAIVKAYNQDKSKTTFSRDDVVMSLAAAFGESLVKGLGMDWALAGDTIIVINVDKGVLGSPADFSAARIDGSTMTFVAAYEEMATKIGLPSRPGS